MKWRFLTVAIFIFSFFTFAQDFEAGKTDWDSLPSITNPPEVVIEGESEDGPRDFGEVVIPNAKRPKKIDSEKIKKSEENSEKGSLEKNKEIIKFGMENEITDLIDKLQKDEDVRFVEEIYDLFQETKSSAVREKILDYFIKLEDPCLEDYVVEILDDPFDQKNSTVNLCFTYVQKLHTKEALPAVLRLIDAEDENYFNAALTTVGEIGEAEEAVYLTEFLERTDLPLAQRQALVKVLGKIRAVETFDSLVAMAEDEDENSFVRMYCAEAIGAMLKNEAVPVLTNLFEANDPRIRQFALKGLSYFINSQSKDAEKEGEEAKNIVLQATRDSQVIVRNEAISIIKDKNIQEAVPYLVFRAKNDPEVSVKNASYPVLAQLNTKEGNEFLISLVSDKKVGDTAKTKVVAALLEKWEENSRAGKDEILELAETAVAEDRRKPLRYALGKEFAKSGDAAFEKICEKYLDSKDVATVGTGLDIYAKGRYSSLRPKIETLAKEHEKYLEYEENKATLDPKTRPVRKNANAEKAYRLLNSGIDKMR